MDAGTTQDSSIPTANQNPYHAASGDGGASAVYRAVSRGAVVSLVLALFSAIGFLFPRTLFLPLLAVGVGLLALRKIRRYPDEFTGRPVAVAGTLLGLVIFVAATTKHTVEYVTEVPEGYTRMSFAELKPEAGASSPIPDDARDLAGKRIFVKGYVHPGVRGLGPIRQFVLVPDMGTCCFGGQPALWDMIVVELDGDLQIKYSQRRRKLGGVLRVNEEVRPVTGGLEGGLYVLEADYLK